MGKLSSIGILGFMIMILIMGILSTGCQSRHTINAGGTATVKHVITIEFGVCDTLPDDAKIECVKTLLDLLIEATKAQNGASQASGLGGIGDI